MSHTNNPGSLWSLSSGQFCIITGFDSEMDPRYLDRVLELGFRPNTRIECIKSPAFGAPKVYRINSSVFSLDDSIASCIFVCDTEVL